MIPQSQILYAVVLIVMFCCSFYALSCIDFSRFTRKNSTQKIYLLLFLLSLSIAWMATSAIFSLSGGYL